MSPRAACPAWILPAIVLVLACAEPASAATIAGAPCSLRVTAADTIFAGELSHEGCDVVVAAGGALVVRGPHAFASVRVEPGGVLACAQLDSLTIAVAGDLTIAAGGRVLADGRGYGPGQGPGAGASGSLASGGSHGGRGGTSGGAASGAAYDAFATPSLPGSGGGSDFNVGGRGGGALRLSVGGTLRVDGTLSARGDSSVATGSSWDPGGGAGGSIHVQAGALAGAGTIDASGGRGVNLGGGGGGGRVAVECVASTFAGTTRASGGDGANPAARGGAGTVWRRTGGVGELLVDNAGLVTSRAAEMPDSNTTVPGALRVRAGGIVSRGLGQPLSLAVQGDAVVEAGGAISLDVRGYAPLEGPGAGFASSLPSGASHGGRGGWSGSTASGPTYGSYSQPVEMGSGGGTELNPGGRGGGALRLIVSGALVVDGAVTARGDSGTSSGATLDPGGGSGGSVWITTSSLAGAGVIDASGGRGGNLGGSGGGGRVAVEYGASTYTGVMRAAGAPGATTAAAGGAGTVWRFESGAARGELIVDNGGLASARSAEMPDSLVVVSGDLRVRGRGIVSRALERPLAMHVQGSIVVESDGAIAMDGRGHAPASGPGAGGSASLPSGGSHAGRGGQSTRASGPTYGSFIAPTTMGSGGGTELNLGGRGGGALRLIADGTLVVDGVVSARGDSAISTGATLDPGGGAGGSVWVTAASLAGAGRFDVSGGGGGNHGGAGGAGRLALEYGSSAFTGALRAMGGFGADSTLYGGAGTIWSRDTDEPRGELRVDAGGVAASSATELPDSFTVVPGSVRVRGRGLLAVAKQTHMHLEVEGSVWVESDGAISVAGRGHPAMAGPGAGQPGSLPSGGSHAGLGGGGGGGNPPGPTYGSASQPLDFGSGGGTELIVGGAGGGALRFVVADTLRVDGTVSARGGSPVSTAAGLDPAGGAGGSLWMSASVVTGTGTLDASGGDGGGMGGGGGGGRVSLSTLCFDGFSGEQIRVAGGRGGPPAAGAGTIVPDFARGIAAGVIAAAGAARRHFVPVSLADGAFESADSVSAIVERRDVQLPAPLPVDIAFPATAGDTAHFTRASLDSGLWVNAHVLHFDPPAPGTRLRGSVTFDTNVLGLVVTGDALVATDALLHAPGMAYPGAPARGLEFEGAESDTIELSSDRRTVTLSAGSTGGADEVRVITAVPLSTCGPVAGLDEPPAPAMPNRVAFAAPAPNPSRGAVRLRFALPRAMPVRLDVLDVAGRRVATLADGERAVGEHAVAWAPARAVPGVYFARLATAEGVQVRTIVRVD